MYPSWPPKYPPYQQQKYFPTTYTQPQFLPTQQPQHSPDLYRLVPLEQAPKPRQTSPQMRIYDESNPNQFINQSEGNILRDFKKFLEQNPDKISKLSTSNIKISYKILNGNKLSLSFDFIDSDKENQNHNLTFINDKDTKLVATKSNSILEMEETAKLKAEERAKREAEERAEKEKLAIALAEIALIDAVREIAEEKKMPMMKEIESEITKITNVAQSRLSALNLIESTDHKQSPSAIASINKSTFDCVRSSQKENNFYEILTEDGEAKQLLIAYLAEYDDDQKSKKLTSLVELITEKNNTYKEPQSPSVDKEMIMKDLIMDLGTKILANFDMAASELKGNNRAMAESNALKNTEDEENAKNLKHPIANKLSKTTEKLKEFLEKTGFTEESLKKIIEERSSNPQSSPTHAKTSSAQAIARI